MFNASIPFDKESIHEEGSMRSNDNGDTMSNMVGTVLSGFEYKAQKEKYDKLTKFFKTMKKNINIPVLLKKQYIRHRMLDIKMSIII